MTKVKNGYANKSAFQISEKQFQNYESDGKSWDYNDAFTIEDLPRFPLIEDFEIVIFGDHTEQLGKHIKFFSKIHGDLTSFPWWDRVDEMTRDWTMADIPMGTLEEPFDDLEEAWQVLIFAHRDWVYILEGDEPGCEEFGVWYKVPKDTYLSEWQKSLKNLAGPNAI